LWQYHQAHEIPRQWWAWDYTLSWLIENNHQPVKHKIVIFNHQLEDEPPVEAVAEHPWLTPLLQHPLSRATMADIIDFLGKSGVGLILLDNDFPQYTAGDSKLAQAIADCASGKLCGHPVPILMARTVNRRSNSTSVQLEVPSKPSGILDGLTELEPGVDLLEKYVGITGILPDEDQVVRRIALTLPGLNGQDHDSIVVKAVKALHEQLPENLPDTMDIDFSAPPNSELYPVRPLSYLLDPSRRKEMTSPSPGSTDVTLCDAVVVLGDGVVDIFNTPYTNVGMNQMSGSEVLVHALETVSRRSWPIRVEGWSALAYTALISLAGSISWLIWKRIQHATMGFVKATVVSRILRIGADLFCFVFMLAGVFILSCLLFAYTRLLVPVFVPSAALGLGAFAAMIWEREREREETFKVKLSAAQEKLTLARDRYEADLKRQQAEAENREILMDRQRRHEFVRRINHDLNAPVSVLNWTLAELQEELLDAESRRERISRLVKNSDKLCELIDQLVQTYDFEDSTEQNSTLPGTCNLNKVLEDCLDLQKPLAEMHSCQVNLVMPPGSLWVRANALEISRVVDNLVRNAIKHNPQGTGVTVTLKSNGSFHHILVSDNGKGIATEHLNHIFEPGYRIDSSRKDSQGLGLDIVKSLIDRMGGNVTVESSLGKGTSFCIQLAICSPPATGCNGDHAEETGEPA
jgi:signal transduction histidine kinase